MTTLMALSCAGRGVAPSPTREQTGMLRGERDVCGTRKTSANRPQPWDPNANPLEEDRFGIEAEMARRRRDHAAEHNRAAISMDEFSHPACGALTREERRTCPLLGIAWTDRRNTPGGVELQARNFRGDPAKVRWQFLCHIAYGRARGGEATCPLQLPRVAVSTQVIEQTLTVRVVTEDPDSVEKLRQQISEIVP